MIVVMMIADSDLGWCSMILTMLRAADNEEEADDDNHADNDRHADDEEDKNENAYADNDNHDHGDGDDGNSCDDDGDDDDDDDDDEDEDEDEDDDDDDDDASLSFYSNALSTSMAGGSLELHVGQISSAHHYVTTYSHHIQLHIEVWKWVQPRHTCFYKHIVHIQHILCILSIYGQ